MIEAPADHSAQVTDRPAGYVLPGDEIAQRAIAALDEHRYPDVDLLLAEIPRETPIQRAWGLYLDARLGIDRTEFEDATAFLTESAVLALTSAHGYEDVVDGDAMRLAALVFQKLGWIRRRRDDPDHAYRTHRAAMALREAHGSIEEMWETAVSLGIDADLGRRFAEGRRWHRRAIDLGSESSKEPDKKRGIALTNLAASLTDSGDHTAAVEAAQRAREAWTAHDVSGVAVPKADMNLGFALLKQGEALHDTDRATAATALTNARSLLGDAREALTAFGGDYAADARWCDEQIDFAERLMATLE